MKIALCAALAAVFLAGFPGVSQAVEDDRRGVLPAGRQAIVTGSILDIDPDGLTIDNMGREIEIDAESLIQGAGDMNDYYDEGMIVTVEGMLTDEDKIAASRITQGVPFDSRYNDIPPYIVNNPGIIGADELD